MNENFPVQQTEPNIYALTNTELVHTEEEFFLHFHSGNSIRRYQLAPKHMKRISLLIDRELAKFEETHGEIKTNLTTPKRRVVKQKKIGFRSK